MVGYEEADKKIIEYLIPYKKNNENCKVSGTIEYNSKFYREVIFYKKSLMKIKLKVNGYLYLDAEGRAVADKTLLKELTKLAYYYEIFFSNDKATSILATLKTELDMQKDKKNVEEIGEGLDFLTEKKVYSAEKVKNVVIRMFKLKENSNIILKELSNIIINLRQQDSKFNLELFNMLYPYHENILKLNFEKVSNIALLEECIDEVIREAEKIRKKWGVRIIKNMVGKLIKVSDELTYYKRLITIYRSVLHMNNNQYIKYLNNLDKERIEIRNSLIRY